MLLSVTIHLLDVSEWLGQPAPEFAGTIFGKGMIENPHERSPGAVISEVIEELQILNGAAAELHTVRPQRKLLNIAENKSKMHKYTNLQ